MNKKYWYRYVYTKCPACLEIELVLKRRVYNLPDPKKERWVEYCDSCSEDLTPVELLEMGG